MRPGCDHEMRQGRITLPYSACSTGIELRTDSWNLQGIAEPRTTLHSARGRTRTCDPRLRRPKLHPISTAHTGQMMQKCDHGR